MVKEGQVINRFSILSSYKPKFHPPLFKKAPKKDMYLAITLQNSLLQATNSGYSGKK